MMEPVIRVLLRAALVMFTALLVVFVVARQITGDSAQAWAIAENALYGEILLFSGIGMIRMWWKGRGGNGRRY
jgi:ABC-type dipeptide/oligopeptide/nickel transport system permease component